MTLTDFFSANGKAAIAFSGGVDSSYLLYAAALAAADVTAYCVRSRFQPEFEFDDAVAVMDQIRDILPQSGELKMRVLDVDVLSDETVRSNPPDRCYYCKCVIMDAIIVAARADGYDMICDGTNASDDIEDRPGWNALRERGIRSPLRECGLTKPEIRELCRKAGLTIWNKPAYACLATRIPTGEMITEEKLARTEKAELLMKQMGFVDFRVRTRGDDALVQVKAEQYGLAKELERDILDALGKMYSDVKIDSNLR